MAKSPLRYDKLIRELPKHVHAKDALIASGFSEKTAEKQSKRVLRSAIRHQAEMILNNNKNDNVSSKQLMSDIVGLSRGDIMDRLKTIALQDKDLHSALKVLSVLASQHGVSLDTNENSVTVPILNITVDKVVKDEVLLERETNMPSEIVIG